MDEEEVVVVVVEVVCGRHHGKVQGGVGGVGTIWEGKGLVLVVVKGKAVPGEREGESWEVGRGVVDGLDVLTEAEGDHTRGKLSMIS